MTLIFTTTTEFDLTAALTFGLSDKITDSPIGHFGTGLKNAIAITLRLGGTFSLQLADKTHLEFYTDRSIGGFVPRSRNGKEYDMVNYREACRANALASSCHFTTDLGKSWEPWEAFRELVSNNRDEGGIMERCQSSSSHTVLAEIYPQPAGSTRIFLTCPEIEQTKLSDVFIPEKEKPLFSSPRLEIYPQPPDEPCYIFYKTVRVGILDRVTAYRYNFLFSADITLTENRSLKYSWEPRTALGQYVPDIIEQNPALALHICTRPNGFLEHDIILNWNKQSTLDFCAEHINLADFNPNIMQAYRARLPQFYQKYSPTQLELSRLTRSLEFLAKANHTIIFPIECVVMPANQLGEAKDGKILLSKTVLSTDTRTICKTLIEEQLHLSTGVADFTYEIQHEYLNMILNLMQELTQTSL